MDTREVATIRVVCLGLSRTGTFSMKTALELLDKGPCYHMSEVIQTEGHAELWQKVEAAQRAGGKVDGMIEEAFHGGPIKYRSTADFPGINVWRELLRMWPDAKVLMKRDTPDKWFESVASTIGSVDIRDLQSASDKTTSDLLSALVWENADFFDGKMPSDPRFCKGFYTDWNEKIRAAVPSHQLLEFNLKEGWEPLCAFLGCAVPQADFPHVNDAKSFHELARKIWKVKTDSSAPETAKAAISSHQF